MSCSDIILNQVVPYPPTTSSSVTALFPLETRRLTLHRLTLPPHDAGAARRGLPARRARLRVAGHRAHLDQLAVLARQVGLHEGVVIFEKVVGDGDRVSRLITRCRASLLGLVALVARPGQHGQCKKERPKYYQGEQEHCVTISRLCSHESGAVLVFVHSDA